MRIRETDAAKYQYVKEEDFVSGDYEEVYLFRDCRLLDGSYYGKNYGGVEMLLCDKDMLSMTFTTFLEGERK